MQPRLPCFLYVVEHFPNPLQTYTVNVMAEVLRRGAQISIVAAGKYPVNFARKVEELGLIEKTSYQRLENVPDFLLRCLPFALPVTRRNLRAWTGLARYIRSRAGKGYDGRGWVKAALRAPILARGPFDLVHAHYLIGAYDYAFVARAYQAPLVLTFHGNPLTGSARLSPPRRAALFAEVTFCLVNTEFARRELESKGCPPEKIRVVPQGLALDEFPFVPRRFPSAGPVVLLTVARLGADKGHEYAIRAVQELVQQKRNLEYRIVGSGPERKRLEDLVAQLHLQRYVRFLGSLPDEEVKRMYRESHILILPSVDSTDPAMHIETQGVVIQEAQASGTLVVATRTGGIPECVEDGRSAWLVPNRNPEALAGAIAWLLDRPEQWESWQRAARIWVEQHFAMEKIGGRLWDLYQEALSRNAASSGAVPR